MTTTDNWLADFAYQVLVSNASQLANLDKDARPLTYTTLYDVLKKSLENAYMDMEDTVSTAIDSYKDCLNQVKAWQTEYEHTDKELIISGKDLFAHPIWLATLFDKHKEINKVDQWADQINFINLDQYYLIANDATSLVKIDNDQLLLLQKIQTLTVHLHQALKDGDPFYLDREED